jgi:hypothetical protein
MNKFYFLRNIIISLMFLSLSSVTVSQTIPLSEDFEGATYVVTPGGNPAWSINTTLQVSGTNSYHNTVALNDTSWFVTDA